MRAAITHRDTKTLCGTNRNIGSEFARRRKKQQTHKVASNCYESAMLVCRFAKSPIVVDLAIARGVLHNCTEIFSAPFMGTVIANDDFNTKRQCSCPNDFERLRKNIFADK